MHGRYAEGMPMQNKLSLFIDLFFLGLSYLSWNHPGSLYPTGRRRVVDRVKPEDDNLKWLFLFVIRLRHLLLARRS